MKHRFSKKELMKKSWILLILLLTFSFVQNSYARPIIPILGGQRVGTSAMTFLKIPIGARAEAMGGAYVGLANDAFAAYWNPAGIAQINNRWVGKHTYDLDADNPNYSHRPTPYARLSAGDRAFGAVRINWIADITYDYIAYSQKTDYGHFGVHFASLSTADMERTTEVNPDGDGTYFSYSDMLFGATYALEMTKNFSWGLSLKYAREDLAGYIMQNVMLDLGTYYWTGFRDLRIGVALVNFGPNSKPDGSYTYTDDDDNEITRDFKAYAPPTEFRLGGAMTLLAYGQHRFLGSMQLNHPVDNAENFKFGGEYAFSGMLFLRGGLKVNTDEDGWTLGGGVRVPWRGVAAAVDYSFTDFGILEETHRFSIGFEF